MYDLFTREALDVMTMAREKAKTFQHVAVDSGHLLLSLVECGQGEGRGFDVLHYLPGVSYGSLVGAVEKLFEGRTIAPQRLEGHLPLTNGAKISLEKAAEVSAYFGHQQINPRHILYGLLDENLNTINSVGYLLRRLGLQPIRVEVDLRRKPHRCRR